MSDAISSRSAALGFWVTHQEAMEAFVYESDDDNPAELQKIFEDQRYSDLLDQIENVSADDGDALVHALVSRVAETWMHHPNLAVDRKRKAKDWSEKFSVRRKRARKGDAAEFGVYLETNAKLGMTLYAYLWTKGGKAAAEFNAHCIREESGEYVLKGSDDLTRHWHSGIILLARIPLGGFMRELELDCTALFDEACVQVARCTPEALAKILEKGL